jgi:protein SCO1
MKSLRHLLVVLIILLVPSVFYLVVRTGKNNFIPLPVMGPREAPATAGGDTVYHTIGDYELISHLGQPVSQANFEGKILVTDFFFVTARPFVRK